MPYVVDMKAAALRHYNDARCLEDAKRIDNAGYHYGLAAEAAFKHVLISVGVREDEAAVWKHFPDLTDHAKLAIRERRAAPVRAMLDKRPMQGWSIKMRYAKTGSVSSATLTKWRDDANNVLGLLHG